LDDRRPVMLDKDVATVRAWMKDAKWLADNDSPNIAAKGVDALAAFARIEAELKRLTAGLPVTKDGVYVLDGAVVFRPTASAPIRLCARLTPNLSQYQPYSWDRCYSTEEAARAAAKEAT
jgi:hypothetical protein